MTKRLFYKKKLPLNTEPLDSNAWLAGFIEGDGHFYVRVTGAKKINYGVVECRFELTQAQNSYPFFGSEAWGG